MLTFNVLRKRCTKCKTEKSVALGFCRSELNSDGYLSWCKMCSAESCERTRKGDMEKSNLVRATYIINLRIRALQKLGDKCAMCGFDDPRALQFDHVNNDGCADPMRYTRKRCSLFQAVLRDTNNVFQILCANCNTIKAFEFNKLKRIARRAA